MDLLDGEMERGPASCVVQYRASFGEQAFKTRLGKLQRSSPIAFQVAEAMVRRTPAQQQIRLVEQFVETQWILSNARLHAGPAPRKFIQQETNRTWLQVIELIRLAFDCKRNGI